MSVTEDKFNKIEAKIKSSSFLDNSGLGNEVGYYVFDYEPQEEMFVRDGIEKLVTKINGGEYGFKIKVFDLYDMTIDYLKSKGYLEKCFQFEKRNGFGRITKSLSELLRLSDGEENKIAKMIQDETPEHSVIFVIGVGKCYPFLRSHNVLNNLHQIIDKVPVVLFYPGKYNGQQLFLLNEIEDDNYYRAFPLVD